MTSLFKKLSLYITLTIHILKNGILSAMEYRGAFLMQVTGIFINDLFFIVMWALFFAQFPSIHGWTFEHNMVMLAQANIVFGGLFVMCGGWNFSRAITRGELDYYLTLPKSALWQLLVSKVEISAIGDLVFGVLVYGIWGDISVFGISRFVISSVLSLAIVLNFLIITQSLAFYLGQFEETAQQLLYLLFGFTLYPQNQFHGGLKVVMMTFLPVFFVTFLPLQLIQQFDWYTVGILLLFWLGTALLAVLIFRHGLKRYESGNLIHVRL